MSQQKMYLYGALGVCVLLVVLFAFLANKDVTENSLNQETPNELPEVITPDEPDVMPGTYAYGTVETAVGKKIEFDELSLRVVRVVEESRCPSDVTCIQAGTVRVEVEIVSGLGTSSMTIGLLETVTTEAEAITFKEASPYPVSTSEISPSSYIFTFEVVEQEPAFSDLPITRGEVPAPITPSKTCYVGGCSAQLCTDNPDIASTCEYRDTYACYQTAACEVQATGECGWTPTDELKACLANPPSLI